MFDRIGRRPAASRRRQAVSLLLSLTLNSSLLWVAASLSTQVVTELPGQALAVEITMVEAAGDGGGVALPAAPAPTPSGGGSPALDEPQAEPVARPVAADSDSGPAPPAVGSGEGSGSGGGGGGTGTGEGGGSGEGPGDGEAGSAVLLIEQVRPLRIVEPRFPAAARALGMEEVRCTAEVHIDDKGRPTSVRVEDCPPIYAAAVQAAMLKWRFTPARQEGHAVPARFRQPFRFVLR